MDYPEQAGENINNLWRDQVGLNQPREYDIEDLQRQRYEQVTREIEEKFRGFFEAQPEPQYREYESPVEEQIKEETAVEQKPSGFIQGFRSFGGRIKRLFGRK